MTDDPELEAMAKMVEAFEPLDAATRARILEWADLRYGKMDGIIVGLGEQVTRLAQELKEARAAGSMGT